MKYGSRYWDKNEIATAARIYANMTKRGHRRKETVVTISRTLRSRTPSAVCHRLSERGPNFEGPRNPRRPLWRLKKWNPGYNSDPYRNANGTTSRVEIPESVLIERDHRINVKHESLTAEFFGDPRPGYSALDRMRAR